MRANKAMPGLAPWVDAVLLTAAGDDPGPAGKMFLATKRLSTRKPAFSLKAVAELADLLGLAWDYRLTAAVDHTDEALQSGRPAPLAAADLVTAIHTVRPDAEPPIIKRSFLTTDFVPGRSRAGKATTHLATAPKLFR